MIFKEKIFGLDLMRCTAILLVLFAHTCFLLPFSVQTADILLRCFGFIGVEIFFVLSGYLVGKILIGLFRNNPVNFRTTFYFWIRRWFRTLPNYYLALLLSAGVFYFSYRAFIFSDPAHLLYFIFFQNFVSPHPQFFSLAWSLSIEEWFYFIMPLWFILWHKIAKGKKSYIMSAVVSFMLLIFICRIIAHYVSPYGWNEGIRRIVVLRLDAIMTGVLAALLHVDWPRVWQKFKKAFLAAGLSMLIIMSVLFYPHVAELNTGNRFFMDTFFFNIVSAGIALTLPYLSGWQIQSVNWLQRFIIHTSRISYSLYLMHVIVVFAVLTLLNKLLPGFGLIKFTAGWVACFIVAGILYAKFELPVMNKRDKYRL